MHKLSGERVEAIYLGYSISRVFSTSVYIKNNIKSSTPEIIEILDVVINTSYCLDY